MERERERERTVNRAQSCELAILVANCNGGKRIDFWNSRSNQNKNEL